MSESQAAIVEMVDAIDKWHKDAHDRLRKESDEQKATIDSNYKYLRDRAELTDRRLEALATSVTNQQQASVNIDKILFTPRVVTILVASLLSIWAFFWSTAGGLRSDVRDILTKMEAQKTAFDARASAQDIQATTLRNDVSDMKRQLQLQQFEIQNLKDLVTQKKAGK